ncbi:MAG TPA: 4Fe-4S binding protein, partial [Spirochaetota bacterium]|nr:4Fe-4S binding protein [Spirochaetota bacterium]
YRELQLHLDKHPIGYPATESGVELNILKYFFSEEEARISLCLGLTNSSPRRIAGRYKRKYGTVYDIDDLKEKLDALFMKGCIRRSDRAPYKYGSAMLALGMFEFHVDDLTVELMEMLHSYYDEAFQDEFFRASIPQLRTSPHMKAIVPEHRIDTYDNMRAFIAKTKQVIHVANCVCKQGEAILGKPCQVTDDIEICIQFGEGGYLDRGRSRLISKEEALAILDKAEDRGLVIQPANSLQPLCICLCCGCCCGVLTSAKKFEKPVELFATNYEIRIDAESCTGCGLCVKRCPMDALTREGKKIIVNMDRCIGCGVCAVKCPTKAAVLVPKSKKKRPPINTEHLYMSILAKKAGRMKMIINLLKLAAGMRL